MVLENLGRSLDKAIRRIRRLPKIDKEAINALIQDLQRALLSADVKVELVFEMTESIKKEAMNIQFLFIFLK
jgi:signal recognition particle subunit SRP54